VAGWRLLKPSIRNQKQKEMEAVAKLRNYPTSPRKMRLLADLIRGEKVEKALAILEHSAKHPAVPMRKLVLSAIDNWKQKNEGGDEGQLIVKTIMGDGARVIKRMRPAPQGRGYRVRKRSNHVTVIVDTKANKTNNVSKENNQ
jgi:large subunit ribosomal protein L22